MKRFNIFLISQAALLLGAVSLNASSITLTVEPSSTSVVTGGTVSAAIDIAGLTSTTLGAYELTLTYNSAFLGTPIVTFGDQSLGDQLALTVSPLTCIGTACGAASNFPLEIAEVSLDPSATLEADQASAFTLATISFTALAPGTSGLNLSGVLLSDENGRSLTVGGLVDSSIQVNPKGVAVTPEPRTGILLPVAMALAGLFIRRRWSSASA